MDVYIDTVKILRNLSDKTFHYTKESKMEPSYRIWTFYEINETSTRGILFHLTWNDVDDASIQEGQSQYYKTLPAKKVGTWLRPNNTCKTVILR